MNRFILSLRRLGLAAAAAPFALAAVPACTTTTTNPSAGSSGTTADAGPPAEDEEDSGIPAGGTQCTAARKAHLVPIAKVSTAEVKVLSTTDGVTRLYVDASAGGAMGRRRARACTSSSPARRST